MEETSLVARQVGDSLDHQMDEEVVEEVEVDEAKIIQDTNKYQNEKQELAATGDLENFQNYNQEKDFAPKYQNEEIEKLFELADAHKCSNLEESKSENQDLDNQVSTVTPSRESSRRSKSSEMEKENLRKDPTDSENQALMPAVKPVPAPRRFFLEESSEVKTDFRQDKLETVRDRAKTFSYISSYYLQGTLPASAGTISKIF